MIVRTEKHLDEKQTADLQELHHTASTTPAIVLRYNPPPWSEYPVDEATYAWIRFHEAMDKAAVEAGLPEPEKDEDGDAIHYGLDFKTREILGWAP